MYYTGDILSIVSLSDIPGQDFICIAHEVSLPQPLLYKYIYLYISEVEQSAQRSLSILYLRMHRR